MSEDKMKKSMGAARNLAPPGPGNVARNLSPATRPQAERRVIKDVFEHDVALQLAFLGAGQGGGRIADAFYRLGYRRVGVFNTTDSDFDGLNVEARLSLDVGGAAKDAQLAERQLSGREPEVHDLLTRAWGSELDCALICAGLGGGTGSGTIAKLVEIARRYMEGQPACKVGAIVSLPPISEGQQVARNAVIALQRLLELKVSPLVVIDNARINELYRPVMSKLHSTANETVAQLLDLFNQLAARKCPLKRLMTFDQGELSQLFDNGLVVMGAADFDVEKITSPADVSQKIREELTKNVLATVEMKTGRKAACLFVGGQDVFDKLGLEYFEAGFNQLDLLLNGSGTAEPPVLHRGLYVDDSQAGLQCYTMIAGCQPPQKALRGLADKAGMPPEVRSRVADFLGLGD